MRNAIVRTVPATTLVKMRSLLVRAVRTSPAIFEPARLFRCLAKDVAHGNAERSQCKVWTRQKRCNIQGDPVFIANAANTFKDFIEQDVISGEDGCRLTALATLLAGFDKIDFTALDTGQLSAVGDFSNLLHALHEMEFDRDKRFVGILPAYRRACRSILTFVCESPGAANPDSVDRQALFNLTTFIKLMHRIAKDSRNMNALTRDAAKVTTGALAEVLAGRAIDRRGVSALCADLAYFWKAQFDLPGSNRMEQAQALPNCPGRDMLAYLLKRGTKNTLSGAYTNN